MKHFLTLLVFFICNSTIGQKLNFAKLNLKDSCIISGGVIEMKDLKKICKICPPETKKVNSFIISYTETPPLYLELICTKNHWDLNFLVKKAVPDRTFMIEEIKAVGINGQALPVKTMFIGFK